MKDQLKEILDKYPKEVKDIKIKDIVPNQWNPNEQQDIVFNSLKKSIEKYGWLQFPVVREIPGQYEVIDGEHRYKAAKELNLETIKCLVLGNDDNFVKEEDAKILTQLLNNRGQDNILKRAELLKSLKESNQQDLFGLLSMTQEEIDENLKLLDFDFSQYENIEKEVKDIDEIGKICKFIFTSENMLKNLHIQTNNTKLKVLIESFFEWRNAFCNEIKNE